MLRQIQQETREWRMRNFPIEHRSAAMQVLGVCEETGELSHAVLKDIQGIRGTHADHVEEARDAMGDIIIYLCGVADAMGVELAECVESAWNEVRQRDWVAYKEAGVDQPTVEETLVEAHESPEALQKARRALRPEDPNAA